MSRTRKNPAAGPAADPATPFTLDGLRKIATRRSKKTKVEIAADQPDPVPAADSEQQVETVVEQHLDEPAFPEVQLGFSIFNPIPVKETMMSKADVDKATRTPKSKEQREAEMLARQTEKLARQSERRAAQEAHEAEMLARKQAREAAKLARQAEIGHQAKMAALMEAKKHYTKSTTGQLRSNDAIAVALDAVPPANVIKLAMNLLQITVNPYQRLNTGQQSMNLRNKLRGALKRGVLTLDQIIEARDSGGYVSHSVEPEPETAEV